MCTFGIYARDFARKRDYPSHRPSQPAAQMQQTKKKPCPKKKRLTLRTYKQWSDAGYYVRLGQKHVARDADGTCLFSEEQVAKKRLMYNPGDEYDEDYEQMWYDMYGYDRDWI